MRLVELFAELGNGVFEHRLADGNRGGDPAFALQSFGQLFCLRPNAGRIFGPIIGNLRQQRAETRPAPAIFRWEIGAGEKRLLIRRQKHRHRPAPLAVVHRHRRRHVNLVEIRPFLAIHFDADKMAIHDGGDRRVFKRLPLHHMAPVTGRVADRQQDRLVRRPGGGQRFRPPGIPIDGVIGMLQEIGTGLGMEPVRLAVRCG